MTLQRFVVFVALAAFVTGCDGRSTEGAGPPGRGAPPDAGLDGHSEASLFRCSSESGFDVRLRFEHWLPLDASVFPQVIVRAWAQNHAQVVFATDDDLVVLALDGSELARFHGAEPRGVRALSPLATSALVARDGKLVHVDSTGDTIATLTPNIASGWEEEGIVEARFSDTGGSLILGMGGFDLRGSWVKAVETRHLDGTLLRRFDGWVGLLRNDDDGTVVGIYEDQVVAMSAEGIELWRATNHDRLHLIRGSRSVRSVFVHSDSLGFYAGANNDGLLVVDGVARSALYMLPAGFSPNGRWVASSVYADVSMRDFGEEVWRATPTRDFLADSVSVSDDGYVLTSGTADLGATDGGQDIRAFAVLYDRDGTLLYACEKAGLATLTHSSFSHDGRSFALYGAFGAAVYDVP